MLVPDVVGAFDIRSENDVRRDSTQMVLQLLRSMVGISGKPLILDDKLLNLERLGLNFVR
jgi:hypothetical protein